jgi:hypothetical protein
MCPEFRDYNIQTNEFFQTAEQFDSFIENFQTPKANDFMKRMYQCERWDQQLVRYPTSFMCAFIVQTSTAAFNCNTKPTNLCKSSAVQHIVSMRNITRNPEFCSNRTSIPQAYVDFAQQLPDSGSCIHGLGSEADCGGDGFCAANPNDPCCVARRSRVNVPLISILASVGALFLFGVCFYFYRRHNQGMIVMECISSYHARSEDECTVVIGDLVQIVSRSREWVKVKNLTQKTKGMCPAECLLPVISK